MFNSILDDFKNAWNKPNNGLAQLIIINVIVFIFLVLIEFLSGITGSPVFQVIGKQFVIPAPIKEFIFRPWTIITYAFAHSLHNIWHILMNMLVLYWFGRIFVDFLGSQRLINLYVLGAIGGALTYLIVYNSIPFYEARTAYFDGMVGASAAVFAITVATAAYFPDYKFYLLFLGPVKIKYIAIFFIFTSFIGITGSNAGGNLAHLGGALVGWYYARRLKTGSEIGLWVFKTMEFFKSFFVAKPKIRVSHRQTKTPGSSSSPQKSSTIDQKEIDAILDKISVGGYDSLTKEEKEKLFNASK